MSKTRRLVRALLSRGCRGSCWRRSRRYARALRGRTERPDYRPMLAGLDMPALVVGGSADPWSNDAVIAEIAAFLKHPEVVVFDGAGHLPNLEAERAFNNALRAFLLLNAPA